MVNAWSPAIDQTVSAGTITSAQGQQYRQALIVAFASEVNWDGWAAMPTFAGV
ncbi:hypothetical protein LFM09_09880 [Lentzea alba]|uniref:hypothetical protein n=1 Tax=Lentzea alba TaxID=2714351 RepID=UPI0039BF0CC8